MKELTAKDLMIGDWVTWASFMKDHKEGERLPHVQITQLNYTDDGHVFYDDKKDSPVCFGEAIFTFEVAGIPLTPEILEKNGFGYVLKVKEWAHFYLGKEHCENADYHIGTNNRGIYWLNTGRNSIYGLEFVHELQHALRLCGIEKEIEL